MNRLHVILLVGFLFLVPLKSWAEPPLPQMSLQDRVKKLEELVASLQAQLAAEVNATLASAKAYTDSKIPASDPFVTNLKTYMNIDTLTHKLTFTGANVQIVDGSGSTYPPTLDSSTGFGNLIIGYDEIRNDGPEVCSKHNYTTKEECEADQGVWARNHKSGTHNLIIGPYHNYPGIGGFVAGIFNTIKDHSTTVSGGIFNTANVLVDTIFGGATVSGGALNTASGNYTTVSGGLGNTASGDSSSVSGGAYNTASGSYSTVSGGRINTASGGDSVVSGGLYNTASGGYSVVSGGIFNTASGGYSTVSGGDNIEASGESQHLP